MYSIIKKWGNSQAIRIPKDILEMVSLSENDKVEIKVREGELVIVPVKKHKTLKERIAEYDGKSGCNEWKTGRAKGKEVW